MKAFVRNIRYKVLDARASWWLFWKNKFLKSYNFKAYIICRQRLREANQDKLLVFRSYCAN